MDTEWTAHEGNEIYTLRVAFIHFFKVFVHFERQLHENNSVISTETETEVQLITL